jgi:N-acetylglucosaminyldiphosphoundecaprenol N-acetyl-beta-D-mannosaminyltransferase
MGCGEKRVDVFGACISAISLTSAVELIEERIVSRKGGYVCTCPVATIIHVGQNEEAKRINKKSFLSTPDGKPVEWYIKGKGFKNVTQVCGRDLMRELFLASERRKYRHFFFGGAEDTLAKLKNILLKQFPWLDICGMCAPPFKEDVGREPKEIITLINSADPDVLWVGLGSPKQEKWMYYNSHRIKGAVSIGVGAAFNFYAGTVGSAPPWIQRIGLEWLFRLSCEPRRLWKRYLYGNSKFIYLVLKELTEKRSTRKG